MTPQWLAAVLWYLLLAGLGWLVLPIAYCFLGGLADRGYAFLRPLGLLLWGFVFWLLGSYGLLRNDIAGLLTAAVLVGAVSWWAWRSLPPGELRKWLKDQRGTVIAMEVVFVLAFLFMTLIRVGRPEINHTEQPMELAFINAILRSPTMPPHDPWLSGFSISYYYFGYLMVAMLAKLVDITGSVAFNLGFITIFSMSALAAYGLAYNLISLYKAKVQRGLLWLAALAPIFVLILSNGEGLLEIAHARHAFWGADASGAQQSAVWSWLDIDDLNVPPSQPPSWTPRLYGTGAWWWWRGSRVINDKTLDGGHQELIDEFPAFSYTLGDLHPHVLSMPFVMLGVALALNLYSGGAERKEPLPLLGVRIREDYLALSLVVLGGLAFLNIWDFPIYGALFGFAYILRSAQRQGWSWEWGFELLVLGITILIGGILLYLPFYIGFTSQAGGVMPNLINPSRGVQLWVMFGLLWIPLLIYLVRLWRKEAKWDGLPAALLYGFVFVIGFWLLSLLLSTLYATILSGGQLGQILASLGAPDIGSLLSVSLQRRLAASGGWITLALLMGLVFGLVIRVPAAKVAGNPQFQARSFLLLLAFVATLLVIAPEFIYLLDQFGTRMNTVFKFFYQAWQMWAVVAAVGCVILLHELTRLARAAFAGLLILLMAAGLIYPLFSFTDITRNYAGTLDGANWISTDVRAALAWLREAPLGTLVEAVGGSYDASFARYAAHTGQMGVMGWPGHEGQWRGGNVDWTRIDNIQILYSTQDWSTARDILAEYDVDYVVVGEWERNKYELSETKFAENLPIAFQNNSVTIYQVP